MSNTSSKRTALALGGSLALGLALLVSPAHAGPSDAWITTKAKAALLTTKGVPSTDINVDTTDGKVTLKGTVPTESDRKKAEAAVKDIDGVKHVDNQLKVASHPETQGRRY
jgi:osmotically-inducible protein OsmY